MPLLARLERLPQTASVVGSAVLIGIIGLIDALSGYEFSLSLFYMLPIALITWRAGRRLGVTAAGVSALVWLGADVGSGHLYSHPLIPLWNTLIRLAYFVIIVLLMAALKRTLQREGELARVDYLTGATNSRHFYERAEAEMERLRRYQHPLTVAYIDLDNFKQVNDEYGHPTGDRALQVVAAAIRAHIRRTDVLARMGGDEFAVLLPETDQAAAQVVLGKLHTALLHSMAQPSWPITFSVGVITYTTAPPTTDMLVKLADDLMYSVKHRGKHALAYAAYSG